MNEPRRLWISISAAVWLGASAMTPADAQEETADRASKPADASAVHAAPASEPAGTAMAGSEGNALAEDDVAFLERLGLIRGHLRVGNALYQGGQREMSVTHMKHPRDELYAGLVPAIEARGARPFDEALTALAEAAESNADEAIVQQAWEHVDAAIAAIEITVAPPADVEFVAAARILRTAGEEYAIGVVDGEIANLHEYQTAWGFTQVADQRLANIETRDNEVRDVVFRARGLIAQLEPLWPSLVPQGPIDGSATTLFGAAARVELLGNRLRR